MKHCPYCAESIEDAAVFCQYCGHDTGKPPTPPARRFAPAPEPAIHEPSRSAGPVIAILLVLAVVIGGVWLAIDGKNLGIISADSNTAPPPTLPAPAPTPRPQATPQVVNTAFEAGYYARVLDGWQCKLDSQDRVVFTGKVQNIGKRPIRALGLRAYIYDQNGTTVNSNTGSPTLNSCLRADDVGAFTIYVARHGKTMSECGVNVESVTFTDYGEYLCTDKQTSASSPASKATAGSASSTTGGSLLSTMTRIRKNIQALAQDAEVVHCERNLSDSVLNNYEAVINAPKFNVTGAAQTAAYADYRSAVDIITRTSKDMYLHCSAWVKGTATTNVVPRQTWGTARQGVDQALQAIDAGLAKLK